MSLSEHELMHHLDGLSERGLLMRQNDTYLGLAVLRGAPIGIDAMGAAPLVLEPVRGELHDAGRLPPL